MSRDTLGRWASYRSAARARAWDYETDLAYWTSPPHRNDAELASFLDQFGTSEEIEIRLDAALTLLHSMNRTTLDEERRGAVSDALAELGRHLEELQDTARSVASALGERGWRFERDAGEWRWEVRHPQPGSPFRSIPSGRLKAIQGPGDANRPEELLNREIRELCQRWEVSSNTEELRHRLAKALEDVFPPDQLDPRYRGPIWRAVNNYCSARRPRQSSPAKSPPTA